MGLGLLWLVAKSKKGSFSGEMLPQLLPQKIMDSLRVHYLIVLIGAGTTNRTRDLLITNQLLYQLSYAGLV